MAAQTPLLVFKDGDTHRTALYRVLNVTTGDTIDVSSEFRKLTVMDIMPLSVTISNFPANPTNVGTVITVAQTGLANDAIYLLVSGGAA